MERNKRFADKYSFNFPLLSDVTKQMAVDYGAADDTSARSARRAGVIIGPDGKIAHWWKSVNSRAFPNKALERIG